MLKIRLLALNLLMFLRQQIDRFSLRFQLAFRLLRTFVFQLHPRRESGEIFDSDIYTEYTAIIQQQSET